MAVDTKQSVILSKVQFSWKEEVRKNDAQNDIKLVR